jgi:hypothetical protein
MLDSMRKRGFQAPGMGVPDADGRPRPVVIKGRGANSNHASRFLPTRSEAQSDGWEAVGDAAGDAVDDAGEFSGDVAASNASSVATELFPDRTRRLITRNQSPDIPFDRSINPYKGCEHGCVYCFARPTHA